MKIKKLLCVFLTLALVLTLLPTAAWAVSTSDTIDLGDSTTLSGTNWRYVNNVFIVTGDVTVTGTTTNTNSRIVVTGSASITLSNASIDVSAIDDACAFSITGSNEVNLTLIGNSTLKSGKGRAGLEVTTGNTLNITSLNGGMLDVYGGFGGAGIGGSAGIGGGAGIDGGNITISGGTVNAYGGNGGAGIGGGAGTGGTISGEGGTITISGGTVNAVGGLGWRDEDSTDPINVIKQVLGGGAGIGSGGGYYNSNSTAHLSGNSGEITISGTAVVNATGGDGNGSATEYSHAGAGIGTGGGAYQGAAGTPDTISIITTGSVTANGGMGNDANANDGAPIGAGGGEIGDGKEIVKFLAQGSVNLDSPSDLIFKADDVTLLEGFTFFNVRFISPAGKDGQELYPIGGNNGIGEIVEYGENTGILTVPSMAFAMHQGDPLTEGSYIAVITFEVDETLAYIAYTVRFDLTKNPPPATGGGYIPQPTPEPEPDKKNPTISLTEKDLDEMWENAVDGVMVLKIYGDHDSLQIDLPLSWFMENLGATMLVYCEGLGMLAVTSENMIELAALAYEGEGGVTVVINGTEFTFNPETLISYLMLRGSIDLSVTSNGNSLDWYIYDSPIILGVPENIDDTSDSDHDLWVAYKKLPNGEEEIIPRSLRRGALIYALVNNEGVFDVKYNEKSFDDVSGTWMESAVRFVAAREIVMGTGDNRFEPDRKVTRAEYITMLMRMMDYEMTDYDPMPFHDIEPGSWYYESVCKAAALGITSGTGEGAFSPDNTITRQEMFTMSYNALTRFWLLMPGEEAPDLLGGFIDSSEISDWALCAMDELVRNGLIEGYSDSLNPKNTATRAEAAQFIANILKFILPDYNELIEE